MEAHVIWGRTAWGVLASLLVSMGVCTLALSTGCDRNRDAVLDGRPSHNEPGPLAAQVSSEAVRYARELGGRSHQGETLYLVVITRDTSEAVVAERLRYAVPTFGDAADYFVVLPTDWLLGMSRGQFIAAEAYPSAADARESLPWWEGRVSADWYRPFIQKVTVETDSPIPVVGVDVGPPD